MDDVPSRLKKDVFQGTELEKTDSYGISPFSILGLIAYPAALGIGIRLFLFFVELYRNPFQGVIKTIV